MKLIDIYKKNIIAFWISIIYVSFGGLVACSLYPDDPLNGEWWFLGWLITLPVNIVSFVYRSAASTNYWPVIIIQFIIFIVVFLSWAKINERIKRNTNTRKL